ncbi:hypothetical protein [Mycobacteroides abscessus]|uniref:hypothetical protein n=1 Tax=Mycobacteroides abscessus TaxID=36809 RepID=UPI001ED9A9A3|nr:hypothetical protein [Mycobacteroides abscessus]MDO2969904.1 hypothetical protein [Mycobacteroides abscessus subsp. bolletii]MDO3079906.1 hypothetical protein [Mycobacteroides abscessus subsp. bolletii]
MIEQVRRFIWSIITPTRSSTNSAGTAVAVGTAPTLRGLAVVCSTINGSATAGISEKPEEEMYAATRALPVARMSTHRRTLLVTASVPS